MTSHGFDSSHSVAGPRRVVQGRSRTSVAGLILVVVAAVAIAFAASASTPRVPSPVGGTVSTSAPEDSGTALDPTEGYWTSVSDFVLTNWRYESLEAMTEDVDLVVRGHLVGVVVKRIQSFEQNELHESLPSAFGIVEIDEVLKGKPASQTPGTVLVARLGVADAESASLPKESVILFLKSYAQMRRDAGVTPSKDAEDQYFYARPNGYQCLLREVDGRVALVPGPEGWAEALGPFPSELEGMSVSTVLAEIARTAHSADVPT